MVTVEGRLEQALNKRPRNLRTWASVAKEAGVPAGWLRSFGRGHIHAGDPLRIKAVCDVLGLDYRELLALTDQLGEVETVTAVPVAAPPDVSALVAALDRQTAAINALVERLGDPSETAAVVAQTVMAMLRASGVLASSPERSESGAPLKGRAG